MTVRTFRKKPVTVRAVQWTGDNQAEVEAFLGADFAGWRTYTSPPVLLIRTLENPEDPFQAPAGWWVLEGVAGEHYACRADILEATYEDAGVLPVADGTCGHPACDGKGAYRMTGSCSNCLSGPFEVLFTAGHPVRAVDCPVCGVRRLQPSRTADIGAVAS